jgi:2,3-bisphosphoglycerate-dependent phosphoglycerate mutase
VWIVQRWSCDTRAMRLYFIRHAQSTNNALFDNTGGEQGRSDDPELSDLGVQQAKCLAQHIGGTKAGLEPGGFGLTHLYASPMVRAAQTASEISGITGLRLHIWEDWHEVGGIWLENETGERIGRTGKNRTYLEKRFPGVHVPESIGEAGWWSRPHETDDQIFARAEHAWQGLLERHGGTLDRVAIVSHGTFFTCIMAAIFKLEIGRGKIWLSKHNTAITRIDHRETEYDSTVLVYQNQVAHLLPTLIS